MPITGIISEYNPFHNGHKYLINKHKKHYPNNYIIAVMSGNFTQRGEIAILNKWQRANLAINNGIDLVLELPFVFAVRSAEYFAKGGINLLNKLNCVDTICFGSEYIQQDILFKLAKCSLEKDFTLGLKKNLALGLSYAQSISKALSEFTNIEENILKAPNTILGLEYIKASLKMNSSFNFDIIKRIKTGHNDLNYQENFASGTAIRHSLYQNKPDFIKLKQVVPYDTFSILKNTFECNNLPSEHNLFISLITKLRLSKLEDIKNIYGIREGLDYKLLNAINNITNPYELLQQLKSKRYPSTNLQRLFLYLLLNITKQQIEKFDINNALYARVLAFNNNGAKILRQLKKTSTIPIIMKTTSYLDSKKRRQNNLTTLEEMLSIDTYASELYNLCFTPIKSYGLDFTTTPKYYK